MQTAQATRVSIPTLTQWGTHANVAGRPVIWGTLIISSITGTRVAGTINFRGNPISILGYWNDNSNKITFDSPYATFSGDLTIFDDPAIRIRHYVLSGPLKMKPPSQLAGRFGTWIATTNTSLNESTTSGSPLPHHADSLPPVGVFLTSDLLINPRRR